MGGLAIWLEVLTTNYCFEREITGAYRASKDMRIEKKIYIYMLIDKEESDIICF